VPLSLLPLSWRLPGPGMPLPQPWPCLNLRVTFVTPAWLRGVLGGFPSARYAFPKPFLHRSRLYPFGRCICRSPPHSFSLSRRLPRLRHPPRPTPRTTTITIAINGTSTCTCTSTGTSTSTSTNTYTSTTTSAFVTTVTMKAPLSLHLGDDIAG